MNPAAVEHAKIRLAKAKDAREKLANAKTHVEAEGAWTDFLLACSTIYTKLEQGAKASGRSQGWYGRKKKVRKDDPLLRYIHQARNTDEHTLLFVTQQKGKSFGFSEASDLPESGSFGHTYRAMVYKIDKTTGQKVGPGTKAIIQGPHIKLLPVFNTQYNDTFHPPHEHLGKKIDFPLPLIVADLAIAYFETLIAEAEGFV